MTRTACIIALPGPHRQSQAEPCPFCRGAGYTHSVISGIDACKVCADLAEAEWCARQGEAPDR